MELIPPEQLIKDNSIGEGDFCAIGEAMVRGLIERGLLAPAFRVLDVGCGLGRLARPLIKFLKGGEYYGLDINRSSVDWCTANYAPYPNFHFGWIDAYSKFYNPGSTCRASEYEFPFPEQHFDLVMLTSVFTHMMLADVDHYLGEVARVLKPRGRCYATYFLLTPEYNKAFATQPQYHPIPGGFVGDKEVPEKVVFLREDLLRRVYAKHRLSIEAVNYGSWSGRADAGGYQDEIVAARIPATVAVRGRSRPSLWR